VQRFKFWLFLSTLIQTASLDIYFLSVLTLMFGNGLLAAAKMTKNPNKPPAAKPLRKRVFLKTLV